MSREPHSSADRATGWLATSHRRCNHDVRAGDTRASWAPPGEYGRISLDGHPATASLAFLSSLTAPRSATLATAADSATPTTAPKFIVAGRRRRLTTSRAAGSAAGRGRPRAGAHLSTGADPLAARFRLPIKTHTHTHTGTTLQPPQLAFCCVFFLNRITSHAEIEGLSRRVITQKLLNTRLSEVIGLLEEVGRVSKPRRKLAVGNRERRSFERLFLQSVHTHTTALVDWITRFHVLFLFFH